MESISNYSRLLILFYPLFCILLHTAKTSYLKIDSIFLDWYKAFETIKCRSIWNLHEIRNFTWVLLLVYLCIIFFWTSEKLNLSILLHTSLLLRCDIIRDIRYRNYHFIIFYMIRFFPATAMIMT